MKAVNLVVLVYALLTIAMGVYGYTNKGSMVSMVAGGVSGLLLLGSLALYKSNPRAGRIGAAVISLLLLLRFIGPFLSSGDWVPGGVMTLASGFTLAVLVGGHFAAMSKRKREGAEKA
jgi:uncharacterized membrane protein (UPF0136 family)